MKTRIFQGVTVTESCGNIFADLDLENPEELLLKAHLGGMIRDEIAARKLTDAQAGELFGISPSDVFRMTNKFPHFSLERLVSFLAKLGYRVEPQMVPISPPP